VAGLRNCAVLHGSATPRCVWNPDMDSPVVYTNGWITQPAREAFDNAFKVRWELSLRHVVKDEAFWWSLREGAKDVQLAELGLQSWSERRWLDVPEPK
jgi:hypothetical protein